MKHLHMKKGWYYFVKSVNGKVKWIALKTQDHSEAVKRWAELEGKPEILDQVLNGTRPIVEMRLSALQFEFREHFMARCTPNTVRSYERALKTILTRLGDIGIRSIDRKILIQLRDSLFGTPYEGNLTLRVASVMLQFAIDKGYIETNPAFFLKKHREKRIRLKLDVKTLFERILPAAEPDMRTAILLAWQLAQHENEVRTMKWEHIDLSLGKCTFTRKKTGKVIQANLSAPIIEYLSKLPRTSSFVLNYNGQPYADRHFRDLWHRALKKAGVNGFMFKEIRHLSNSVMDAKGISVHERMKLTGHQSIAVNERYTHDLGTDGKASEVLGAVWREYVRS